METFEDMIDPWEKRVRELEDEGCTRSDAQAIADAEFAKEEGKA